MQNLNKTILIVEDEKPLLDAISDKLVSSEFDILTARTVEQAKNHVLDVEKIDAIWLDHYLLGKESGLDFVAWCREEDAKCKVIPIFVVTNTAGIDKKTTYLELGASEYFIKADHRLDDIITRIKKRLS
jgi:DNA-binding response OmpR family regulator